MANRPVRIKLKGRSYFFSIKFIKDLVEYNFTKASLDHTVSRRISFRIIKI